MPRRPRPAQETDPSPMGWETVCTTIPLEKGGRKQVDRTEKQAVVDKLHERFSRSRAAVLADYRGLTVEEVTGLRKKLRASGVDLKVVKNTLARRAAQGTPAEGLAAHLRGPMAIALSYDDPVAPARLLAEFAKGQEKVKIMGGVVEGAFLDAAGIRRVAELPGLNALRGKIAGLLSAPAGRLVGVLAAPGGQIARVLKARAEAGS